VLAISFSAGKTSERNEPLVSRSVRRGFTISGIVQETGMDTQATEEVPMVRYVPGRGRDKLHEYGEVTNFSFRPQGEISAPSSFGELYKHMVSFP
jgi:hypothetical protein